MQPIQYTELLSEDALHRAWRSVKGKGSAGGVDKVTIAQFEKNAPQEIRQLLKELSTGQYVPEPYLAVKIPKNKAGEYRQLGLLTVRDKIVQQAIYSIIYEPLEKMFLGSSYGYRRGKGSVKAVRRVWHCIRMEKRRWVAELDFDDFFDNIPHSFLEEKLKKVIQEPRLVGLIMLCVKMGKVDKRLDWKDIDKGVPQGAILSPVLANLYLHEFDEYMDSLKAGYVRYADDFLLLSWSRKDAEDLLQKAIHFAKHTLRLPLNRGYKVKHLREGIEFLGLTFYENTFGLSAEKQEKLCQNLSKAVQWHNGKLAPKLEQAVEGIRRYYLQVLSEEQLLPLDAHLKKVIADSIGNNRSRFRSLKSLRQALSPLLFITSSYNDKRSDIINELVGFGKVKPPPQVKVSQEGALRRKKKEYERLQSASMELLVSKPGVYLGISRQGINVRERGKNLLTMPTANIQHISVLSTGVSLSSNLIYHCAEHQIPIDFYDKLGKPFARIYNEATTDSNLWLEQANAFQDGRATLLACTIVSGKARNQLNLLKYYFKHYKGGDQELLQLYSRNIAEMSQIIGKVRKWEKEKDHEQLRGRLFAAEGRVGALYWQLIAQLLDDNHGFEGRSRQGATDLVNSLLNYGYGILYSRLWDAVLKARLNPYISYLHVGQPGKPTLTFDLIEEFRQPAVDRPVMAMLKRKEKLRTENGRLTLDTRKKVAERVLERLNSKEKFRGRRLRLSDIIRQQARDFAAFLGGRLPSYKPYTFKW